MTRLVHGFCRAQYVLVPQSLKRFCVVCPDLNLWCPCYGIYYCLMSVLLVLLVYDRNTIALCVTHLPIVLKLSCVQVGQSC